MSEKIGLQSQFDTSDIEKGAKSYNKSVEDMLKKSQQVSDGINKSFQGMGGVFTDANGRLRDINGRFISMGGAAGQASTGIRGLGTSFIGLNLPSFGGLLTGIAGGIVNIGMVAGTAAVGGIAALSAGLIGIGVSGVKAAMDVDHQMAQIAATLGTTKDAAMPLKDLMSELALDPGLTVNATQAGQAIEMLAANGLELEEILDGAAKGTVQLANATGSDFTTAATIATDAMAQFGIGAKDLSQVADGISGVLIQTKFSADDYSLALSNAGGIAASLGVDYSDFNTVLAATASNFSSGSDAGTSFKTLLTRLADPTDEVKAAMEQYGISIFDADGKMRKFSDIAGQLNQVFNGTVTLTNQVGGATKEQAKAAEKASAAIGDLTRDISQQEQEYQVALDVYNKHLEYYDASEPKMRAEALALQKKADALNDQKEKLSDYQSAIDTVNNAQIKSISTTKELTEAEKAQLATILGGTDAMRTILGLAEYSAEEFAALSGEVNQNGLAAESAATRVDSLKGAWEIFLGIIEALQIQIGDSFLPLIRQITENFSQLAAKYGPQVVAVFGQIADTITKVSSAFSKFGARGATVSFLGQLGLEQDQIQTAMANIDNITGKVQSVMMTFQQFGAQEATFSILSMLGLSDENIAIVETSINTIQTTFNSFMEWWNQNWPFMAATALVAWEILQGIFVGLQNAGAIIGPQLQVAFDNLNLALANMGLNWEVIWEKIKQATGIVVVSIGALIVGIIASVAGLANGIASGVATISGLFVTLSANVQAIAAGLGQYWGGLIQIWAGVVASFQTGQVQWETIWNGIRDSAAGSITIIMGLVDSFNDIFKGVFDTVINFSKGFAEGIVAVFQGVYDTLVGHSIIPDMINGIVNWFRSLPGKVMGIIANFAKEVIRPFETMWDNVNEIFNPEKWTVLGEDIVTGVIEGIEENADKVLEILKAMAQDALQGVMDMLGISSPSTEFAEIGLQMMQGLIVGVDGMGDSVQDAIRRELDFTAGMFIDFDLNETERNAAEASIKSVFDKMYSQVAAGTAGISELMVEFRAELVATGEFNEQEISEAMSAVNFQEIVDTIRSQFGPLTIELKAQAVGLAQSFSGIAVSFADMLMEEMGSMDEARKVYEAYTKEMAKITTESEKLATSLSKVEEKSEDLQYDLTSEIEKQRILGEEIELKNKKIGDWKAELDALVASGQGQSEQADKLRKKIKAEEIARDKLNLKYSEHEKAINEITEALDEQTEAVAALQAELDAAAEAQAELNKKAKEQAFETLTQGHGGGAFAAIADQIAALEAFLDSGEETLTGQVWDDALGQWANWSLDRNTAQIRLNELLEEQLELEEEIRKAQEQQQQIAFLQQQINLMKLIADQGLDPAEILGGITLGLDASVEDLLTATSAVVQAMIDQINADLQIASPSKVMAKIGKQTMAGLIGSIENSQSSAKSAMMQTGDKLLQGANSMMSTVNNYNNQSFNVAFNGSDNGNAQLSSLMFRNYVRSNI